MSNPNELGDTSFGGAVNDRTAAVPQDINASSRRSSRQFFPPSENAAKIRNWVKAWQPKRTLPLEGYGNITRGNHVMPFCLRIDKVTGIKPETFGLAPDSDKLGGRVSVTMYSPQTRAFFGRRYLSDVYPLTVDGPARQLSGVECMYYFSKLAGDRRFCGIVELILVEFDSYGGIRRQFGAGYATVSAFEPQAGIGESEFVQGTPMDLMITTGQGVSGNFVGQKVYYEVSKCDSLMYMDRLIPENAVVGVLDNVSGLEGGYMPLQPTQGFRTLQGGRTYVNQIQVKVSPQLEQEVMGFMGVKYQKTFYHQEGQEGLEDRNAKSAEIKEKRLIAAVHNGWTFVNSTKWQNMIMLAEGRTPGVLESDGILALDGIVDSPECAIIFQVEYLIRSFRDNGRYDDVRIVLGWVPFIPAVNRQGELRDVGMSEFMVMGPGHSVNGDYLFESTVQLDQFYEPPLNLTCKFSKQPPMSFAQPQITDNRVDLNYERDRLRDDFHKTRTALEDQKKTEIQRRYEEAEEWKRRYFQTQKETALLRDELQSRQKRPVEVIRVEPEVSRFRGEPSPQRRDQYGGIETRDMRDSRYDTRPEQVVDRMVYEDIPPAKWDKIQGIHAVPRITVYEEPKAFQTAPSFHPREISRADMARLVSAGMKGILDKPGDRGYATQGFHASEKRLDLESEDPLKATSFVIQFLAYRPYNLPKTGGQHFPHRMYFTLNFFDFPQFKTEVVRVRDNQQHSTFSPTKNVEVNATAGTPLVLFKEPKDRVTALIDDSIEDSELLVNFEIDPSTSLDTKEHMRFASYLLEKALNVEIWDADSQMHFGTVRVPLNEMLRQGRPIVAVAREFDCLDQSSGKINGGIQVMLKNSGKYPSVRLPDPNSVNLDAKDQLLKGDTRQAVRIRAKPLTVTTKHGEENPFASDSSQMKLASQNEDLRKKARVQRFKKSSLAKENVQVLGDERQDDYTKHRALRDMNLLRDSRKPALINRVLKDYISHSQNLNVTPGIASFLDYSVANSGPEDEYYQIKIEDPYGYAGKSELDVVMEEQEWRQIVRRKAYDVPIDWGIFHPGERSFYLKPGESLQVLFKFLSFKPKSPFIDTGILSDEDKREYLMNRIIKVTLVKRSGQVLQTLEVNVMPTYPVVDHVLRFYEPESRSIAINLPSFYYYTKATPHNRPKVHCTNQKAVLDWPTDGELIVKMKTPPIAQKNMFYIFAYNDDLFLDCTACIEVNVYGLSVVDMNVSTGQLIANKLSLRGDFPQKIQCYSSEPDIVSFRQPFDGPFLILPGVINNIDFHVRALQSRESKVRIHAVDVATQELVHTWLVRISAETPQVSNLFQLKCKVGVESNQRVKYTNKSALPSVFEFISSNPDILVVREPEIYIDGNDQDFIRVHLPGQSQPGNAEAFVFASDKEGNIFEALMFKINYM